MKKIIGLLLINLVVLKGAAPQNKAEEAAQLAAAIAVSLGDEGAAAAPELRDDAAQLAAAMAASEYEAKKTKWIPSALASIQARGGDENLKMFVGFSGDDYAERPIYDDLNAFSLGHGPFSGAENGMGQHFFLNWNENGVAEGGVSPDMRNLANQLVGRFATIVVDLGTIHHVHARSHFLKYLVLMLKPSGVLNIPEDSYPSIEYCRYFASTVDKVPSSELEAASKEKFEEGRKQSIHQTKHALCSISLGGMFKMCRVEFSDRDASIQHEDPALAVVLMQSGVKELREKSEDMYFFKYTKPA